MVFEGCRLCGGVHAGRSMMGTPGLHALNTPPALQRRRRSRPGAAAGCDGVQPKDCGVLWQRPLSLLRWAARRRAVFQARRAVRNNIPLPFAFSFSLAVFLPRLRLLLCLSFLGTRHVYVQHTRGAVRAGSEEVQAARRQDTLHICLLRQAATRGSSLLCRHLQVCLCVHMLQWPLAGAGMCGLQADSRHSR